MANGSTNLAIVNPASGGGWTGKHWPAIRALLGRHLDFDVAFSQHAGHAIDLGREARRRVYDLVVCVGGDGTLNEIVNGLLAGDSLAPMPRLGIVPSGTGADFARSLGIPRRPKDACLRLAGSRTVSSDLGVVSYTGAQGPARRYFVNAAGLGYDAEVARSRDGFNRYVRGTVPYLLSLAATLLTYRNKDVVVSIDQARDERRINALVVAVGRFFGGGMKIAPGALLDDGYFDVVTIGDVGRLELVYNVPGVYRGTHLRNPKIRVERARDVGVESDQPVLIQADGELLGLAPARFEIIPGALTFHC